MAPYHSITFGMAPTVLDVAKFIMGLGEKRSNKARSSISLDLTVLCFEIMM
jgi:hypothetical protein